jgi:hypothetical protein
MVPMVDILFVVVAWKISVNNVIQHYVKSTTFISSFWFQSLPSSVCIMLGARYSCYSGENRTPAGYCSKKCRRDYRMKKKAQMFLLEPTSPLSSGDDDNGDDD